MIRRIKQFIGWILIVIATVTRWLSEPGQQPKKKRPMVKASVLLENGQIVTALVFADRQSIADEQRTSP